MGYLEDRDVKIHLNTPCRDILHDVDEDGRPTRVTGIKVGKGSNPEYRQFDAVVAALDVPGIKKALPESFRKYEMFDNIYQLDTVPIATIMLRFDGWVTELDDPLKMKDTTGDQADGRAPGIDNLLYSADAEFSCFADLALTSPGEYYKPGEGSLIQAVLTNVPLGDRRNNWSKIASSRSIHYSPPVKNLIAHGPVLLNLERHCIERNRDKISGVPNRLRQLKTSFLLAPTRIRITWTPWREQPGRDLWLRTKLFQGLMDPMGWRLNQRRQQQKNCLPPRSIM